MTFTRFVEAGRIALITYGAHTNKLVIIVDILDQSRVLIDGPTSGLPRQVMNLKRLALTPIKVDGIERGHAIEEVKKLYQAADVDAKFAVSGWGKKLDKKYKRGQLDDFGRFKVMVARMKKSKAVNEQFQKLKATA